MIRVENVTKYYFDRPVLQNVSFTVPEGSNLGLIGPGGAGKTLLLKIICGLVEPDEGATYLMDTKVQDLSVTELDRLRFNVGMLFQNYALFDFMNVEENIAFPLRQEGRLSDAEIREKVKEMLAKVDLPGIAERYPNELSGGMKKRVSFGRAVIPEPPVVFYDDPTAGLDPVTSSKIFLLLQEMKEQRGVTSITITHDIEGIKDICDSFALLDKGRLVFHGDRSEIEKSEIPIVRQFWDGFSDDEY